MPTLTVSSLNIHTTGALFLLSAPIGEQEGPVVGSEAAAIRSLAGRDHRLWPLCVLAGLGRLMLLELGIGLDNKP